MKRSEEEIRIAVLAHRCEKEDCRICWTIKEAIEELLALRRRMGDRETIARKMRDEKLYTWGMLPEEYRKRWLERADAIIKYLEGKDGE